MAIEERVSEKLMKTVARIFKKDISELSKDTRFVEDLKVKSVNVVGMVDQDFALELRAVIRHAEVTLGIVQSGARRPEIRRYVPMGGKGVD